MIGQIKVDMFSIIILTTFTILGLFIISKQKNWRQLSLRFQRIKNVKVNLEKGSFEYKSLNDDNTFYSNLVRLGINEEDLIIVHYWPLSFFFKDLAIPKEILCYKGEKYIFLKKIHYSKNV